MQECVKSTTIRMRTVVEHTTMMEFVLNATLDYTFPHPTVCVRTYTVVSISKEISV